MGWVAKGYDAIGCDVMWCDGVESGVIGCDAIVDNKTGKSEPSHSLSVNQPTTQSITQSVTHSFTQPSCQSVSESVRWSSSQLTNRIMDPSAPLSVHLPVSPPVLLLLLPLFPSSPLVPFLPLPFSSLHFRIRLNLTVFDLTHTDNYRVKSRYSEERTGGNIQNIKNVLK